MDVKKKEMDLLSNSMAAYAHIKGNPESLGLYFVLGVCFGLVLTLCLLVMRISCKPRGRTPAAGAASSAPEKKIPPDEEERESTAEEDDVDDVDEAEVAPPPLAVTTTTTTTTTTEIPAGNRGIGELSDVFASAEELERAQRLEERERIIREIWRNGQPDVLGSGTGTVGRVRYY